MSSAANGDHDLAAKVQSLSQELEEKNGTIGMMKSKTKEFIGKLQMGMTCMCNS